MPRRSILSLLALAATVGALTPARADPPGLSEPVLRPDTQWEKTGWGYKKQNLNLSPPPPAGYPAGYRWPTLMETEGYSGAGRPNAYLRMDDGELMALRVEFGRGPRKDYAYVKASVRGTECSGGAFNLYDRRHAWDGHHIVEWIAAQPWSNGRVGLHGSSLSGQTAYWIATTKPPHLAALSASLLHSDIYRDIFMVGGVQNNLFPAVWTYATGPHRLPQDALQNGTFQSDEICEWNNAVSKYSHLDPPQPENEPLWAAIRSVDDDWYHAHAALTYADTIKIPYYQQANWQDEQTGPRGLILWKHIQPDPRTIVNRAGQTVTIVPKKLALSTGDHGWGQFHNRDLYPWLDIWLLDRADVTGIHDTMVEHYWETRGDPPNSPYTGRKTGSDWPFPDTRWTRAYLHAGGAIDFGGPRASDDGTSDSYASTASRHNWFWYAANAGEQLSSARGLPDAVSYVSPPVGDDPAMPLDGQGNLTVAGPIMVNLWAAIGGTDTDFFVSLADVYPDGSVSLLQRGWLKASHRRVDPLRSYYAADGTTMVIPYMGHTNPQPLVPGELVEYQIEVFPLGHIFRSGHRLLVQVHTPPVVDGLWGYTPTHHQPSVVTISHDAAHPSWIQFPFVTPDSPFGAAPNGCKVPGGFPCYAKPVIGG